MGVRSFCLEVNSVDQLKEIKKWSEIFGHYFWKLVDKYDRGLFPNMDSEIKKRLIELNWFIINDIISVPSELEFQGDTELYVCGFKYYCGKIWLLISTYTSGETVIEALTDKELDIVNFYTRLWAVPSDYDQVPTITLTMDEKLDYEQRWTKAEEMLPKLLDEKERVDDDEYYEKYGFSGLIDFREYAEETPEKYQKLFKLSDSKPL